MSIRCEREFTASLAGASPIHLEMLKDRLRELDRAQCVQRVADWIDKEIQKILDTDDLPEKLPETEIKLLQERWNCLRDLRKVVDNEFLLRNNQTVMSQDVYGELSDFITEIEDQ